MKYLALLFVLLCAGCKHPTPAIEISGPHAHPQMIPCEEAAGKYHCESDGSVAPIGWRGYGVVDSNGKPHMVPEITYDPVCPDGYEIGGPKKDTKWRGYDIDTETLTTNARCWQIGVQP